MSVCVEGLVVCVRGASSGGSSKMPTFEKSEN